MFTFVECSAQQRGAWDACVRSFGGSYCHLFGWKGVFERTYGLRTHYLAIQSAASAETWYALLPVAIMPRLPGGITRAVSLPYCNYGGLLAAPGVEAAPLKAAAVRHLSRLGVDQLEFRELAPGAPDPTEVTMVLAMPENVELLWQKIGDKVRNQVRKAQRASLTLRWGRDQGDILYDIYARNMGRLGTPVHSPRFIREILAAFGESADVLTVRQGDQPIGAMLVIKQGVTWSDPFASCLHEFNALNPNMLLYWEALRLTCESGGRKFDFGRSQKNAGTYRFKRQWGAEEIALNYHAYRNGIPLPAVSTSFYRSPAASLLAGMWQRLPGGIQRRAGPLVRRWMA